MSDYALAMSGDELARYRDLAERAVAAEANEFRCAGIIPGAVVADVGCGPAAVSVELSRVVGPDGRVIAVEPDEQARATAAAVISAAGVTNVELHAGSATDSGLEPAGVDVAMMRHVLSHNGGREQAFVDHLASRVRPGGSVYLVDADNTAVRTMNGPVELSDLFEKYAQFHAARGNDLAVGLRLGSLLEAAGLEVLTFRGWYSIRPSLPGMRPPTWAAREVMLAEGAVTPADVERWAVGFEKSDQAEVRPTLFIPMFVAVGRIANS